MKDKNLKIIFIIFLILVSIIIAQTAVIINVYNFNRQRNLSYTWNLYKSSIYYFFHKNKRPTEYYILVNENGKPVSKEEYSSIVNLQNGYYKVAKNNRYGVINYNGEIVVPIKFSDVILTNDNYLITKKHNSAKYYIYNPDKKLKIVLKSEDSFLPKILEDNLYAVKINNRINIIDKNKKNIIQDKYGEIFINNYDLNKEYINQKLIFRIKKDEKWGLISINNEYIIPPEYEEIQSRKIEKTSDGIYVKKNEKWGKVNFKNEVITDFIYDAEPYNISDAIYVVPVTKNKNSFRKTRPLTKEEKIDSKLKEIETAKQKADAHKKENMKKVIGDLHVVSVSRGYKDYTKNNDKKPPVVTVKVEIKNKPVCLLLISNNAVLWKIEQIPNANIKKIYFMGYQDSDLIAPKNIKIEKIDKAEYINNNNISKIQEILDKKPSSFQHSESTDYFFIDGIEGKMVNKEKFRRYPSTNSGVKLICSINYNCPVSKDGLEGTYANVGAMTTMFTNKYYNRGKYYFEAKVTNEKKVSAYMNIGIASYEPEGYCDLNMKGDDGSCYAYGLIDFQADKKNFYNKTIGIAVDFDNGKIYYSVNGIWDNNCIPEKEKTIYLFNNDGRDYSAAIEAGEGVTWNMNFGAAKFKYPMPKGFRPYDEFSANKNIINNIE